MSTAVIVFAAEERALSFVDRYGSRFGVDSCAELRLVRRTTDALGDHEQAVHWMVQAYEARAPEMCFLQIDTLSASLRSLLLLASAWPATPATLFFFADASAPREWLCAEC